MSLQLKKEEERVVSYLVQLKSRKSILWEVLMYQHNVLFI